MRDKKWVDCPTCGAQGSMKIRQGLSVRRELKGYTPLKIEDLDGQFCEACGDGFWSVKSEQKITRLLGEHMAKEDAKRTVASDLIAVPEAAELLQVSRQAIHKMMDQGRLRYVQTSSLRLPIRKTVMELVPASRRRALRSCG